MHLLHILPTDKDLGLEKMVVNVHLVQVLVNRSLLQKVQLEELILFQIVKKVAFLIFSYFMKKLLIKKTLKLIFAHFFQTDCLCI